MIVDPLFKPPAEMLDVLQLRKEGKIGPNQVKNVTERIAEMACEALLDQLPERHRWQNANSIRRNQAGYDFIVDDQVRIQVKGTDAIEQVGFAFKPDPTHPSLDFDVFVFVHIGACLKSDFGRFAQYGWPVSEHVHYYVIPNTIVRGWVEKPRYLNTGRVEIYWNRRPFAPDSKQHRLQTREILEYRNRFEEITRLL